MLKLGQKARDKVTGFEGIVTGHCSYLTGCDQLLISPPAKDGDFKDGRWIDVNRLEDLGPGVTLDIPEANRLQGGPQDTPTSRPAPNKS